MTFNCQPDWPPHVQSMIMATDQIGMRLLLDECLSECADGHEEGQFSEHIIETTANVDIISGVLCEVSLTGAITDAGYKVDALMTAYRAANGSYVNEDCYPEDPTRYDKSYFGFNLHPYETLFFKANRGLDPLMLESFTEWHTQMAYSSWDACANS